MNSSIITNANDFKETLRDFKGKMYKLLKMCESTDFNINDACDILNDGLLNLIDIKHYNIELQKEVEHFKEITSKQKENVEEKNLNYQNRNHSLLNLMKN
mgnify:CR=1 FL=1